LKKAGEGSKKALQAGCFDNPSGGHGKALVNLTAEVAHTFRLDESAPTQEQWALDSESGPADADELAFLRR
jgi:hypothetical protein